MKWGARELRVRSVSREEVWASAGVQGVPDFFGLSSTVNSAEGGVAADEPRTVDVAADCPVEVLEWLMGLCGFLGDLKSTTQGPQPAHQPRMDFNWAVHCYIDTHWHHCIHHCHGFLCSFCALLLSCLFVFRSAAGAI